MLPPERQDRQSTPEPLYYSLGQTARGLLTQVEHDTGHPVILRYRTADIHGTYAHITYATSDEPHIISIIPQAIPSIDYLVSHECLHALRLFAQPEKERLLAYVDKQNQERATRALVPTIKKRFQHLIPAEQLAGIYQEGVVSQVVNFPMDLRIETVLFEKYPDLRSLQEATLKTNIAELALGLHPLVQAATPPFVFRVQNSLNAAYSIFIARLINNPTLSEPFRKSGYGRVGQELADEVWENRFADYSQDRRDAESWAKRFGVERWFTWMAYRQ